MAHQTLNDLADGLLASIESEKVAELSKTASVSHTPDMKTELGREMLKVAAVIREMSSAEVTDDDIKKFRVLYGV